MFSDDIRKLNKRFASPKIGGRDEALTIEKEDSLEEGVLD
jgi:hypothetical protein